MNSADPDEMPPYAAFHLGLHCLPKYLFTRKRVKRYSAFCEKLISLKDQDMKKYLLLKPGRSFINFITLYLIYRQTAKALASAQSQNPELLLLTPSMDIDKDLGQK